MRTQCYIQVTARHVVLRSGVHSKKILLQSTLLIEVPVTAVLGRVNGASHWNLLTKCCYKLELLCCMAEHFFRRKWKASVA